MSDPSPRSAVPAPARPWDARLAQALVRPLRDGPVTPNHLTSVRLAFGGAAAAALMHGGYGWMNLGALLMVLSNFLDHTDGELARMSGKSTRLGHWYDLSSDALVTILLFVGLGAGVGRTSASLLHLPPFVLGLWVGVAVTLIFYLRMRIEELAGKAGNHQAAVGGFETEDLLYLLPLVTLCDAGGAFLAAATIGAPLFALWVMFDYRGVMHAQPR